MTNVLGIDTGMKNLGLCVMNNSEILLWDVFNILEDDVLYCTKEGCSVKAKWKPGVLCGRHYKGAKETKYAVKQKKCSSYTPEQLATCVSKLFTNLFSDNEEIFKNINLVVFELQPRINQRAKMMSHFIYMKICDYIVTNGLKCKMKFERASCKLKNFKGDKGLYVKNTYTNRKKKSVEYTKQILEDYDPKWLESLENMSKKDDACDALLISYNNCRA